MTTASRPASALPEVIKNLLIINGLFFLAQLVFRAQSANPIFGPLEQWLALWPLGNPDLLPTDAGTFPLGSFYPWQLLTSGFLHADGWHLAFNLYALWLFGQGVERTLGERRFLIFYLLSVLGASVLQLAVTSAPYVLGAEMRPSLFTLGASGGVMGVMAACAILFPRDEIFIIPFPVPIQMRWLALIYVGMDLFGGFSPYSTGVAHFAHLGGFATGALLLLYWRGRLPIRPRTRLA